MFSQFRMVGSPMKGEYDLEITNDTGWDDGFYEFQVTSSKKNNNFEKTKLTYLEVFNLKENYMIFDKQSHGKNIKMVQVTCNSDNDTLKQGDEVILICNINSQSEHYYIYTMYHNNKLLKKQQNKVLYIEHFIPDDHNSRFT
ncbi:Poly-glutamine tract binding protein 1 [Strongyloides ratti]|uniref:Poly-glutamine tract binding protein 1 n=1 Tax=Strongyloides ratti TaxID=34506 RepID=A0A090N0U5_STRRB|nr:Poly-glutamine tract binding protein 1 [Strongyloides ratti]CEF71298.1 Poly-glutamine tract binding protein 1 [Strongyloides ratti]